MFTLRHLKFYFLIYRWLKAFENEGGLAAVAQSYTKYGLNLQENGDIVYREWAPGAQALSIVSLFEILRQSFTSWSAYHLVAVWGLQ